nr:hypothetical protein [Tanacetum cinerariifolium]
MDGASYFNDESPILDGIAKHVKNIDGMISVPKSILKKAVRNVGNDKHEAVKMGNDGGSPSKVSFGAVGDPSAKLSTTDGATDVNGSKTGGSFASLLKPSDAKNKVHFCTLVNEERVKFVDCVLPKAAAAKYVLNTWRKFGFERIIRNDDGVYLFKFATKSGSDQVIEKGPWMIRKSPIILTKWSPNVSLKRGEVTKVPVWVKMYNVPVLAYSEDGLSLLGTQIGLIEIDAAIGLKKEVIMSIPEEKGDGYIKEEVPKNSARETKTTIIEENNDGFTEIKSCRKNKGANFRGIRLNKPKSKVMWQQKKGVDAKSNSTSPGVSPNDVGDDKGMLNPCLNTSNSFDALNADGDDMGNFRTQPKVSEFVSSNLNENRKEASKPNSSKSVYGDGHKDKNVSSPLKLNKWDVINENGTTDDEDVFTSYGGSVGGGNQLEDEDCDLY